jgi:hypothetical protein
MLLELEDQDTLIKNLELTYSPTGSDHRDLALSGIINDAPELVKAAMKHRKWNDINNSLTPVADIERFALQLCGVTSNLNETIKALKKLLYPQHLTIIKAFQNCDLQPDNQLGRKFLTRVKPITKPIRVEESATPVQEINTPVQKDNIVFHPRKQTLENKSTKQIYNFGRGRRPEWVQTWIQIHGNPLDNSK